MSETQSHGLLRKVASGSASIVAGIKFLSPIRMAMWSALTSALATKHMTIGPANNEPERKPIYELIRQVRLETEMILIDDEAYNVYAGVRSTEKIPGDIAEVGVFRGGSAKLICEAKNTRILHLFDTFEGLPGAEESDPLFSKGQFGSSDKAVMQYLQRYSNVFFYKGFFPGTAQPIATNNFSFVHLDVDVYESTLNSLEFFYPRMSKGGMLISHDYMWAEGVRRAFVEFFADKPEPIIELSGSQCAFIKLC
jgi:O-methyltransferase